MVQNQREYYFDNTKEGDAAKKRYQQEQSAAPGNQESVVPEKYERCPRWENMLHAKYNIDIECMELCAALNEIPGVQTFDSCSGHGRGSFKIWFCIDQAFAVDLNIIAKTTKFNYGGFDNWTCIAECDDQVKPGKIGFFLTSGSATGQEAHVQSLMMADVIRQHLNSTFK